MGRQHLAKPTMTMPQTLMWVPVRLHKDDQQSVMAAPGGGYRPGDPLLVGFIRVVSFNMVQMMPSLHCFHFFDGSRMDVLYECQHNPLTHQLELFLQPRLGELLKLRHHPDFQAIGELDL